MAERRMFAKTIIDSDAFIDMPTSSRLLYYDLSMRADDDGFINSPKKIIRMTGASEDDLKVLISKKFIIPFENGVVVIKHWLIHNYIRKDTYNETPYVEQKAKLRLDENKSYTLIETDSQLPVDGSLTQVRLGKVSIDNKKENIIKEKDEKFEIFYKAYPRKVGKANVEKWFSKNKPNDELFNLMMKKLEAFKKSPDWFKDNGQFIPYPATWLNQKRWEDEITVNGTNVFEEDYSVFKESTMSEEDYIRKSENGGKRYV